METSWLSNSLFWHQLGCHDCTNISLQRVASRYLPLTPVMVTIHLLCLVNHVCITLVLTPTSFLLAHAEFVVPKVMLNNTRKAILKHFKGLIVVLMQTVSEIASDVHI